MLYRDTGAEDGSYHLGFPKIRGTSLGVPGQWDYRTLGSPFRLPVPGSCHACEYLQGNRDNTTVILA